MAEQPTRISSLRINQIQAYYAHGGISEVVSRSARLLSRKVLNALIKGSKPEEITPNGTFLFTESVSPLSGMGIGDAICKIPTILAIAEKYNARVHVLTHESRYGLWKSIAGSTISEVIPVSGNGMRRYTHLNLLRAQKYNGIITSNISLDFLPHLLMMRNIAHIKIGNWSAREPSIYRGEELLSRAVALGYANPNSSHTPNLEVKNNWEQEWGVPIIGLHIEAKSALRNYPAWQVLIWDILALHPEAEVHIFWDTNTVEIAKNSRVRDLRTKTPGLRDLYAHLSRCSVLIAPDSGTAHASMALWVQTIVMTSVVRPDRIIPPISRAPIFPIIAPCSLQSPCHEDPRSQGSRCMITGQSDGDFSRTPPCMESSSLWAEVLLALEKVLTQK